LKIRPVDIDGGAHILPVMINRRKVFWLSFGAAYWVLLLVGWFRNPPGAFPHIWWLFVYLGLVAVWAALIAAGVLALTHSRQIASRAMAVGRSIGRWFTT
jgi:hypothetical protein